MILACLVCCLKPFQIGLKYLAPEMVGSQYLRDRHLRMVRSSEIGFLLLALPSEVEVL
jgi:hypothetical protein